MNIEHLGGKDTITGSCHLLQANGLNILIDCGLAQGHDHVLAMSDWPVSPGEIDFVFLTHAHIDHIGRVPELLDSGFRGEILCTHPTKALLNPMLTDALMFTDHSRNRRRILLDRVDEQSWGFEFGRQFDLKKGIRFQFNRAGHILGSSFIRFTNADSQTVTFSGDLGATDTPILRDPDHPEPCDVLVLESTYGNRLHGDRKERVQRLSGILEHCLADHGKVFIPCFALGRTQELLYELNTIKNTSGLDVPVYIDSPLALRLTNIYHQLAPYWDSEARSLFQSGNHPFHFDNLHAVPTQEQHFDLIDTPGPMIILAGSGMCTGGRILDHLEAGLHDERNDILFVGHQAPGTPGRQILRHGRKPGGHVFINGQRYPIMAKVHQLTGYSAHADQQGLVDWVNAMGERPGRIVLVHGEERAKEGLRELLWYENG